MQNQLGHANAEMTRRHQRERNRFRVNLMRAAGLRTEGKVFEFNAKNERELKSSVKKRRVILPWRFKLKSLSKSDIGRRHRGGDLAPGQRCWREQGVRQVIGESASLTLNGS